MWIYAFLTSLLLTMALIPPLMRAAVRWNALDLPDERKVHTGAIPRVGGIAMVAGAVLPILLWADLTRPVTGLLYGVAVLLVFGVLDDRFNLDYRWKFFGQLAAALLVVLWGGVIVERLDLFWIDGIPHWIGIPLSVVFLVGVTNAINLSDGLDGLAGGTTLLSLAVIAVLAYLAGATTLLLIGMAVCGSILGFLRFNTHPAQLFMGDTGSQFLGFSAGVLALVVTQQAAPGLSATLPLLILGLPILDTLTVMSQRIREGRSPFSPDKNHLHHRLLALGLDHYEAVLIIYCAVAALAATAFVLRHESDILLLSLYGLFCAVVLVALWWARRRGLKPRASDADVGWLARYIAALRDSRWLQRGPRLVVACSMAALLIAASALTGVASDDIALSAWPVALLLAVGLWRGAGGMGAVLLRIGLYLACAFAAYQLQSEPGGLAPYWTLVRVMFITLAVAIALAIRAAPRSEFQFSTLDFLVILLAVTVPNLPEVYNPDFDLASLVLKLVVLFYGAELLITRHGRPLYGLGLAALASLLIMGGRGLM
jgi:UDP-GlcNAc:undecaprenyl-phosphate GlcNAc-1-phosphate transferase